ncbi:MAG: trypsin-like peptidase domain-containing protein [Thermodesulfovibrionales bacterium]
MIGLFNLLTTFLLAILTLGIPQASFAQEVFEAPSVQRNDPIGESVEVQKIFKKSQIANKLNIQVPPNEAEKISLGPVDYKKAKQDGRIGNSKEKALQVGIDREVEGFDKKKWRVFKAGDGRYNWRITIYSEGAAFIRPHFVKTCNCDGDIYIYGTKGIESVEGPLNHERLSKTGFWGPIVEGEYLFIEVIQYSDTVPPSLTIDVINHGFRNIQTGGITDPFLLKSDVAKESWCYRDVNCYSDWANKKTAVARYVFQKGPRSSACTGTMLNDQAGSFKNWFLTAHHCIDSESVANTVIAYFRYWTNTCNGTAPSLGTLPKVEGASYRAGADSTTGTDFALLELNSSPPSGTYYLGWTTSDVSTGSAVTGIHHPGGSYQRISFGTVTGSDSNYWIVRWNTSSTEGGSSGSALFVNSTGQIIGQLFGGDASCDNIWGTDEYGKFGVSWNLGLSSYLGGSTPSVRSPVYRFFNTSTGTHFYTISTAERDHVRNTYPQFRYEGEAFYAFTSR